MQPYVLVVDDHPLVARGIALYLQSDCGFAAAHVAADANECRHRIAADGAPALVVLDFWLADAAASDLIREIGSRCPATPVLAMSGDPDNGVVLQARQAGAHGFLRKGEAPSVFSQAVATLLAGGCWFAVPGGDVRTGAGTMFAAANRPTLPLRAAELGLTARQGEVLTMMLRGLPNKRIARELNVSEATVKEHVTHVLSRLGVANRVEAITRLQGRRIEP